jgi:hypothetical protein
MHNNFIWDDENNNLCIIITYGTIQLGLVQRLQLSKHLNQILIHSEELHVVMCAGENSENSQSLHLFPGSCLILQIGICPSCSNKSMQKWTALKIISRLTQAIHCGINAHHNALIQRLSMMQGPEGKRPWLGGYPTPGTPPIVATCISLRGRYIRVNT